MSEQPIKILLIEDNAADANLVERYLQDEPDGSIFELEWIDRVGTGRDRLTEGAHDLVLLRRIRLHFRPLGAFVLPNSRALNDIQRP